MRPHTYYILLGIGLVPLPPTLCTIGLDRVRSLKIGRRHAALGARHRPFGEFSFHAFVTSSGFVFVSTRLCAARVFGLDPINGPVWEWLFHAQFRSSRLAVVVTLVRKTGEFPVRRGIHALCVGSLGREQGYFGPVLGSRFGGGVCQTPVSSQCPSRMHTTVHVTVSPSSSEGETMSAMSDLRSHVG